MLLFNQGWKENAQPILSTEEENIKTKFACYLGNDAPVIVDIGSKDVNIVPFMVDSSSTIEKEVRRESSSVKKVFAETTTPWIQRWTNNPQLTNINSYT